MLLRGDRNITAEHARALGKHFKLDPGAFLWVHRGEGFVAARPRQARLVQLPIPVFNARLGPRGGGRIP